MAKQEVNIPKNIANDTWSIEGFHKRSLISNFVCANKDYGSRIPKKVYTNQDNIVYCKHCAPKTDVLTENPLMDEIIRKQEIVCTHKNKGCKWGGKPQDLESHLKNECLYVVTTCQYCKAFTGIKKDVIQHYNVCDKYFMKCKYNKYGCTEPILYKDMKKHLDSNILMHYILKICYDNKNIMNKFNDLKQKFDEQNKQMIKIEDKIDFATSKMNEVCKKEITIIKNNAEAAKYGTQNNYDTTSVSSLADPDLFGDGTDSTVINLFGDDSDSSSNSTESSD